MRKSLIVVGIIAAVVAVAILIFWATFDINRYRGPIQSNLQERLGRPVTLGVMQLDLLPPRFQVEKVIIGDDPQFGNPRPFIQAEELGVSVKLFPLLRRSVEITSLTLTRPQVELIKNEQGVWNFATLGPASAPEAKEPSTKRSFSLDNFVIEDGQIAMTDRKVRQPRSVYDHIDMTLTDFDPDQQFSVQVAVRLPGKGNQEFRLEGTGGPVPPTDLSSMPFRGTLDLNGVRLAGLQQFLKSPALAGLDGVLTGTTDINIGPEIGSVVGSLHIQDPRVRKIDLGYLITAQYKLRHDLKGGLLSITDATLRLGKTPLALAGTVDMRSSPGQLQLDVVARGISLAEVSRLAAGFGVALSPNTTVKGRANAQIEVRGTTDNPELSGIVSAADIHVSGKDMPIPAQIKSVTFRLTPTEIRSDDFLVNYDGTSIKSRVAVTRYTSENPMVDANMEAPGAKLPAILSIAEAYGVKALDNLKGEGTLNLKVHLAGSVNSLTGDQMLRGLAGVSIVDFNHLRVSGTNLSQEISKVGGFLKPAGSKQGGVTDISTMTGRLTIKNGVAETNDLKAALDLGTIGIAGTADLVTHQLNLHVNAVVAPKVSQQVGGTSIGGYMKTVLANGQGELVVPVLVTGTFQNPQVSPDVKALAQMKLKGIIPTSDNPAAGLAGIVGDILKGKGGNDQAKPAEQQKEQKPPDPLQQMLDILSDRKQPDAPPKPQK